MDHFEKHLSRLSEIVGEIEHSDTTLETALKLYKEGLKLAEKCGKSLHKFETDVLELKSLAEGTLVTTPFSETES